MSATSRRNALTAVAVTVAALKVAAPDAAQAEGCVEMPALKVCLDPPHYFGTFLKLNRSLSLRMFRVCKPAWHTNIAGLLEGA